MLEDNLLSVVNDDEELDVIAFEMWQRGCRKDLASGEDCSDDEEAVGCHATCL